MQTFICIKYIRWISNNTTIHLFFIMVVLSLTLVSQVMFMCFFFKIMQLKILDDGPLFSVNCQHSRGSSVTYSIYIYIPQKNT